MTTMLDRTLVPLSSLPRGARATICRRELETEDRELLAAMGLRDCCEVRICRAGSPCIVQIDRTRLGLSAAIASRVLVHPA